MDIIIFDLLGVFINKEKIASKRLYNFLPEPKTTNSEDLKVRYAEGLKICKMSYREFWESIVGRY